MPIIQIPTCKSFEVSAARFLNHAWEIVMRHMKFIKESDDYADYSGLPKKTKKDRDRLWRAARNSMLLAIAITHDGIDHLLKSRIAKKSPFLLISEPPQKWPKDKTIIFNDFKTIDSQDLVSVHNAIAAQPLPDDFIGKLRKLRLKRNRIIHSVAKDVKPEAHEIILMILSATDLMLGKHSWVGIREDAIENSTDLMWYCYEGEGISSILNQELRFAVDLLEPSEALTYLAVDKKRRYYRCPECLAGAFESERDASEYWPGIAQLTSKTPGSKELYCIACDETYEVVRKACENEHCRGNVIFEEPNSEPRCLTCGEYQNGRE